MHRSVFWGSQDYKEWLVEQLPKSGNERPLASGTHSRGVWGLDKWACLFSIW